MLCVDVHLLLDQIHTQKKKKKNKTTKQKIKYNVVLNVQSLFKNIYKTYSLVCQNNIYVVLNVDNC